MCVQRMLPVSMIYIRPEPGLPLVIAVGSQGRSQVATSGTGVHILFSDFISWMFALEKEAVYNVVFSVLVSAVLGFLAAFLVGVYKRDKGRYAGRWNTGITWYSSWADGLIGKESTHLHSDGRLFLTSGFGKSGFQYWGLSHWELKDGTELYARLCVEMIHIKVANRIFRPAFPFFFTKVITEMQMDSKFRRKEQDFEYHKFVKYFLIVEQANSDRMEGRVEVLESGVTKIVGTFSATRLA